MSEKKFLTVLFISALAIRLVYVIFFAGSYLSQDSGDWLSIARLLVEQHSYGDSWRAPLYSFLLAGTHLFFGESLLAIRIIQAMLGALTCLLVYYIAKSIFHKKAGIISSLLAVFYPYFIYYTGDVLAETLLTFLLAASIACLVYFQQKPDYHRALLAGFCLGLTILCKPVILPLVLLLPLWGIMVFSRPWRQVLGVIALIWLGLLLVMLPWSIRNYFYYHQFSLVSPSGANLWVSYNPLVERLEQIPDLLSAADQNSRTLPADFEYYPRERYAEINRLPRLEGEKVFKEEAWTFIKQHPRKVAWLWYKRLLHFWRLYPLVATPANKLAALLTSGIVIIGGWIGIFISWRYWNKTLLLLLLLSTYTVVYTFFLTNIRYRVPIDTCLMVFAGYALSQCFRGHEQA